MRHGVRIGLIAVAMAVAVAGRGCITAPPPMAESLVAGASKPVAQSSLAPGDAAAPADSTAAPPNAAAPPAVPPPPPPPPPAERRAALDKKLDDSLGAFDARLQQEQQKTAQERDARQSTVSTTTAASTDAPSSSQGARHGDSKGPRAGDLKSEKAAGASGSASGNGALATGIPDGNDDDIVARRIRKAAEQETDPELKDKLWKEYVEYKKNTQVR